MARVLQHAALCTRDIDRALRSMFLGDPARADAGVVELVAFPDGMADGQVAHEPSTGFFLLSFFVDDVEATIDRLCDLGVTDEARRIEVPRPSAPVQMATVCDPDGVLVELIGGAT